MKSPDAMEHMTLKYNFVGHRMVLVWPSVTKDMLGKFSNGNYHMNQCRAIIKKNCPMHNAICNLVLCMGQLNNFDHLRRRALSQNNIRLQKYYYFWDMVQQKCLSKICLPSSVVYEKGGVMHGTQHSLPPNEHCILGDINFKQIRLITYLPC